MRSTVHPAGGSTSRPVRAAIRRARSGATTAGRGLDAATVAAFIGAFAGSAALWWLYFTCARELSERSLDGEASRTGRARDIYTYGHVVIVAGIILVAVGDELVIAHPLDHSGSAQLTAVVAGPVLFLLAQLALQLRATRRLGQTRLAAILACAALGLLGGSLPALLVGAVLIAVALRDQVGQGTTYEVSGDGAGSRTGSQRDRAWRGAARRHRSRVVRCGWDEAVRLCQ